MIYKYIPNKPITYKDIRAVSQEISGSIDNRVTTITIELFNDNKLCFKSFSNIDENDLFAQQKRDENARAEAIKPVLDQYHQYQLFTRIWRLAPIEARRHVEIDNTETAIFEEEKEQTYTYTETTNELAERVKKFVEVLKARIKRDEDILARLDKTDDTNSGAYNTARADILTRDKAYDGCIEALEHILNGYKVSSILYKLY